MLNYIIRKLLYGILVLFGVVTVVFCLFFFKPGDPARMMGGQHASPEALRAINKDLGLDLPFHQQYFLYLNDLSPISVHNKKNEESYIYLWNEMAESPIETEDQGAPIEAEAEKKERYGQLIAQADKLYDKKKYYQAKETYQKALSIFPEQDYPSARVKKIENVAKYNYVGLFSVGNDKVLVLKAPYLRRSYQTKKLVSTIIWERLPGTLVLALTSIVLATIIGVLLGITAAIHKGSFLDNFSLSFSVLGMSGPSYFTGLLIAYIFGSLWRESTSLPILPFVFMGIGILIGAFFDHWIKNPGPHKPSVLSRGLKRGAQALGIGFGVWLVGISINGMAQGSPLPFLNSYFYLPGTGLSSSGSMYEYSLADGRSLALHNLILPALALGIRPLAIVVQLTRSSMLDVLSQDYIRTATAKGLSQKRIILKHALKNAMNPVVTAISGWFALMMAGAIFIEYIFTWRGLGWEVFQALQKDDMPVVMGVVLVIAFIFVLINILVDIVYGFLDPRVRMR